MKNALPDFLSYKHTLDRQHPSGYDIHCHSFFEVYFFLSGNVSYRVEGRCYLPTPNSILLMAPTVLHGIKFHGDCHYERYVIHFSSQAVPPEIRTFLLAPFFPAQPKGIFFSQVGESGIRVLFDNLIACASMPPEVRTAAEHIALQGILLQIARLSTAGQELSKTENVHPVVAGLLQYLNENLSETLSLDGLAARFFISKDHLNRLFKSATGTSIMQYLNYKRISAAQQRILSGEPAAEAAASCGFRDYSVFFRTYRKILGRSPSEDKAQISSTGSFRPPKNQQLASLHNEIYDGPPHEEEIFSYP